MGPEARKKISRPRGWAPVAGAAPRCVRVKWAPMANPARWPAGRTPRTTSRVDGLLDQRRARGTVSLRPTTSAIPPSAAVAHAGRNGSGSVRRQARGRGVVGEPGAQSAEGTQRATASGPPKGGPSLHLCGGRRRTPSPARLASVQAASATLPESPRRPWARFGERHAEGARSVAVRPRPPAAMPARCGRRKSGLRPRLSRMSANSSPPRRNAQSTGAASHAAVAMAPERRSRQRAGGR